LRVGTRVLFEGPYGRLTGLRRERHRLTLIACGIGITPMRALIETEYYRPGDAILIYRARTPSDFTFYREIEAIAQARGVVTVYLPGPRGAAQWLPEGYRDGAAALRHLAPAINDSDVFVCGPEPWMDAVIDSLDRVGVPVAQVHLERFAW
jgi:ferredoxin-NADP reductase